MAKDPKKKEKKEQKNSFIKEVNGELKKVTWPTGKELFTSTATVLFITLTLAVIVFVLDFAFEKANTFGVEKLKSVVSAQAEETPAEETPSEVTEEPTEETPVEESTEVTPESEVVPETEATETTEAE